MASVRKFRVDSLLGLFLALALSGAALSQESVPAAPAATPDSIASAPPPSLAVGPGDTLALKVFDQPDMDGNVFIADDGTIHLPLVGSVQVAGLSPAQVATKIEGALREGGFLVNPHVVVTLAQSVSQLVSVLGEVRTPGRYPVSSKTTVFQLLAEAGGTTTNSADVIYLIRAEADGQQHRYPINLKGYTDTKTELPTQGLKGGDSLFVPHANQFYIYGEVQQPNEYRVESGMTVLQAIARAGGLTVRGSDRRVDIKRTGADGKVMTFRAKQSDLIQANDVIHVKESLF